MLLIVVLLPPHSICLAPANKDAGAKDVIFFLQAILPQVFICFLSLAIIFHEILQMKLIVYKIVSKIIISKTNIVKLIYIHGNTHCRY
ncbi:hypothetical protein DVG78_01165 [Runella aurantiaca]|uniref:Uncharacterized protein n=1 Tax=Runella aurantiaca TaxID=2282308 RepID=A0A369IH67_9BACT|nr:hypothetical protein DVG78_01165 [Runella aurantiaca]